MDRPVGAHRAICPLDYPSPKHLGSGCSRRLASRSRWPVGARPEILRPRRRPTSAGPRPLDEAQHELLAHQLQRTPSRATPRVRTTLQAALLDPAKDRGTPERNDSSRDSSPDANTHRNSPERSRSQGTTRDDAGHHERRLGRALTPSLHVTGRVSPCLGVKWSQV